MFKRPKVKKISVKNKKLRVEYEHRHESETILSFWQYVTFTDEAHVDPGQIHRTCILREEGTRLNPDNMQEMPDTQGIKLHMAASISWHKKGPLIFYNDEQDPPPMQPAVKSTSKPRRSKYVPEDVYQQRVQEWKSQKPHPPEVKAKGNSMTNKYYTEKILPGLLEVINESRKTGRRAILQEDNDPSHGTRGDG